MPAADLEENFPELQSTGYQITSDVNSNYNCIAWALGDTKRWWWPPLSPFDSLSHWPPNVARTETVESFMRVFSLFGYKTCKTGRIEQGWEKIALYADSQGKPTHAARQLPSGAWTSKLGDQEDVEHLAASAVEGRWYGSVVCYFRRRR
jgi:hypothetical protein